MMTAEEIRDVLEDRYPGVTDREFNLQHSGFAHEHPLIAIGVVLISSIVLGTSDPLKLAQYTRYSERFVRAGAANMQNSSLRTDEGYDPSGWYCGSIIPHYEDRTTMLVLLAVFAGASNLNADHFGTRGSGNS